MIKKTFILRNKCSFLIFLFIISLANVCIAKEVDTVKEAFTKGNVSIIIGNYFEFTSADADNSSYGWSNAYLTLKHETLSWNRFKFGARFFAHGELYSDHDNDTTDPYRVDIEKNVTLPEMYLSYGFLQDSIVTIGRWKNVGHLDEKQSEGGYIRINEIEKLEILFGGITRFADIDYDDSENFGRNNNSQYLGSDRTYGAEASSYLFFLEMTYQPIDLLKFNPFYLHHDNYANVVGLETHLVVEWEDYKIKYGVRIIYEHVDADIAGSSDADLFVIIPHVKKGPVALGFSYQKYDDGNSLNHPLWAKDSFSLVDQVSAKNNAGAQVFEYVIKFSTDKAWVSFAYANADYEASTSEGDGYEDYEFQVGYNITDNLKMNIRYFIVSFEHIDNKDYDKIESHVKLTF